MYICHNPSRKTAVQLTAFLLELVGSIMVVYFIAFTFGASLVEQIFENLLFSTLLASIGIMPSLILVPHTNPIHVIRRLLIDRDLETSAEKTCVHVAYGCALGAWTGCFVLPLDWDRWWQQWPLPCCFGALAGASLALVHLFLFDNHQASNVIKKRRRI